MAGCYREWGSGEEKSIGEQIARLDILENQIEALGHLSAEVLISGDFNLNHQRFGDASWELKRVAERFSEICERNSLEIRSVGPTYTYTVDDEVRSSTLDYFLTTKNPETSATATASHCMERFSVGFTDHDAILSVISIGKCLTPISNTTTVSLRTKIKNTIYFKRDIP